MAKKKGKSKMSLSVKKSSKQKKGQQKQSQSLSVNINLGKGKARQSKPQNPKLPAPFPPNYPPFFNQNQPNNWFNPPPPIPQKQYAVFPEGETASQLGLLSSVPVTLRVEGNPLKEKEKEPTLKPAPADENIFKPAPAEDNPFVAPLDIEPTPQFVTSLDEPATENIGDIPLTEEEKALKYILEFGKQPAQPFKQPAQPSLSDVLTPFTAEEEGALQKFKKIRGGQKVKEEERLKKETITGIITGQAPVILEESPKRGRKKGSTNKPKETFDPNQSALGFSQPVVTAEAIPAEITAQGTYTLTAPLGEQPSAQLQPKIIFVGQPAAQPAAEEPAKAETLQRQRKVIERATPEAAVRFVN
jgi:hypothetical protein